MVFINICLSDSLAPTIKLDKSDVSMFDYTKSGFLVAAALGFWDFKFTLFVLCPVYLVGYYFMLKNLNNINLNQAVQINTLIYRELFYVIAVVVVNYQTQL